MQGTYGKVKYGQHADSGEAVAVKVLDKEQLVRSGMVEQIWREITILKQARDACVCWEGCAGCSTCRGRQLAARCTAASRGSCCVCVLRRRCCLRRRPPQIRHPHIVNLLEVMSSRDHIFMIIELVGAAGAGGTSACLRCRGRGNGEWEWW